MPSDDPIRGRVVTGPDMFPKRNLDVPAPLYSSWEDYLAKATPRDRRAWCLRKAKRANRPRLLSNAEERLTVQDVVDVFECALGRCRYCGSLAVEGRPSAANGGPAPWEHVGRRIGSLDHPVSLVDGGRNHITNLTWSCMWCNTWPGERRWGATDHGAIQHR